MAASNAPTSEAGGIDDSDHACKQAEPVQQLKPVFEGEDGEIGGVVEEMLRLAVVHDKRVIDHHEVHIGIAPVDQRVTEQEERECQTGNKGSHPRPPAEGGETGEGVFIGGREARREGANGRLIHPFKLAQRLRQRDCVSAAGR